MTTHAERADNLCREAEEWEKEHHPPKKGGGASLLYQRAQVHATLAVANRPEPDWSHLIYLLIGQISDDTTDLKAELKGIADQVRDLAP